MKLYFQDGTVKTVRSRVNRPYKFSGVMQHKNGYSEWYSNGKNYLDIYENGELFFNPFYYEEIPPAPKGYKF